MSNTEHQSGVVNGNHSSISSGMWLLLFLELIVFGGMIIAFFAFRMLHTSDFMIASKQLSTLLGTLNTILLLTSSLTVALSASSLEGKRTSLAVFFQLASVLFGLFFLINKYYEYAVNSYFGFYPGAVELVKSPNGQSVFCWLYYLASGFHSLLVFIGIVVLGWITATTLKGKANTENSSSITSAVIFWNSLTVIGVLIFSVFYLIG